MARISTYSVDTTLEKSDKLLGSNLGGATRNFTLEDVSKFLKNSNGASYVFHNSTFGGYGSRQNASICSVPILNSGQTNKNFSSLSKLKVSKFANKSSTTSINVLNTFVDKEIIIVDNLDEDKFGVYTCTAVTQDSTETDFYDLDLTYKNGNGAMVVNQFYSIILYSGAQDKSFKHNQVSASNTWVINHNLNKFPNVVVIDSAGSQAIGAVTHDSKNQLTLSFSASFSGVAHLN